MTAKLSVFRTRLDTDKQSVIETLEEVLRQARAGDVQSVSIAVVRPNGALNSAWSNNDSGMVGPMIGAINLLQYRLIKYLDD